MTNAFEFVNPRKTPFVEPKCRGELAHLYKEGGTYFVTFRLWDAVVSAATARRDLLCIKRQEIEPEDVAELSEPPLRLGSCILADVDCAKIVRDALCHFDDSRYRLLAWCVMPNHVHSVFQPIGQESPA